MDKIIGELQGKFNPALQACLCNLILKLFLFTYLLIYPIYFWWNMGFKKNAEKRLASKSSLQKAALFSPRIRLFFAESVT